MTGEARRLQPIIVRRAKKVRHAPHGGAWKIAYADFVTAMMAFFLLMWLLGSTTEGDKKGIADYFQSPLKVALFGGSGSGDSSHVVKGGGQDLTRTSGQVKRSDVEAPHKTINLQALTQEHSRAEIARLATLQVQIEKALRDDPALGPYKSQIRMAMTRDGLRIQIVDELNLPMFDSGSAVVKPHMQALLRTIAASLAEVPNRLTLEGHTDATPFLGSPRGYSNWELSADRANASRRELVAGGLTDDRVLRIQGLASSQLLNREQPDDAQNRRIGIVVMNREAEDRVLRRQLDTAAEAEALIKPERPNLVASQPMLGR